MRTLNVIKNTYIGIVTQVVIILLGFLSRKIFLDSLGNEYLGINGLLTNIISMLGLVEGGIGVSIIYSLYKPLADNDVPKIKGLVDLYKKLYSILAIIILIISIGIFPFLNTIIQRDTAAPYINLIYFIFVSRNIVTYLNAHKWSLINADQKGYIIAKYNLIFNIITTICKIIIIKITKSYVLYLLVELLIFLIQNVYNGKIVNERYPYIKSTEKGEIDNDTRKSIINNVKAIFLHRIGSYCVFGTDNILISIFVNLKSVGLYSNYSMIVGQVSALLSPIFNSIGASVGNLIVTENKEKRYEIFKIIFFLNFWIYSIATIFLYNLLEPFIDVWLGKGLLLDKLSFIAILINFYITGMRQSVDTFKAKAGIFSQDKYMPLLEAIINLGASFIFVKYLGLAGIFIGTTISTMCIPLWNQPRLVYKNVFEKNVISYFIIYLKYVILTIVTTFITSTICTKLAISSGFILLVIKGIICVTIPNIIYLVLFYKTDEFKYLLNIVKPMIIKVQSKLVSV